MRIIRIAVAVTALLTLLVPSWGIAQETTGAPETPAKVAFVQMHMDSTGVSIVKVQVVNGTTKAPSKDPNRPGLVAEMRLADSTVLVVGHLADPLLQRLEYEDPAEPGKLKGILIAKSSADFLVRVPIRDDMVDLNFYRIEAAPEGAGKVARKLVGTFTRIDLQESK